MSVSNIIESDEKEIYWFIKWVKMRYQRNKLQQELNDLKALDVVKVNEENASLRKILQQIREEYQPIKNKIHNGSSKRSNGYGRK